jgi:4'-phosphopantetheinyl transferase EntD
MMNEPLPSRTLESLFPVPVAVSELRGTGDPDQLLPEERAGREHWIAKRQREFAAGRQCARQALQRLGAAHGPLVPRADRSPAWPDGFVGSITHCTGFAAAAAASGDRLLSVGLDAEPCESVDETLWSRILTAREKSWIEEQPIETRRGWATLVFSAKEAFYKCQYPVTARWLEFAEADIQLTTVADLGRPVGLQAVSGRVRLEGWAIRHEGILCTAFTWLR